VHGPTGCGKSDICKTLLDKVYPDCFAQVDCDTFQTSNQLLKAIWIAIINIKFKYETKKLKLSDKKAAQKFSSFQNSSSYRAPSNFGDLASSIGSFLDSFLGCRKALYSAHIVLDEIVKKDNDYLKSSVFNGYDPITGKMRHCCIFRDFMTVSYDYFSYFYCNCNYLFVTAEIEIRFEKRRSHAPIIGPGRPYREARKRPH
jgi:hypothetical protein